MPAIKIKRGRPRKSVAPEALEPFEIPENVSASIFKNPAEEEQGTPDKLANRRLNPATSDRVYTADEVEFMNALAEFKQTSGQKFPTCSEILDVLRGLGYEKNRNGSQELGVRSRSHSIQPKPQ